MFIAMLFPLLVAMMSALFTWAVVRHLEMAHEYRSHAHARPRSRPYATSLPDVLLQSLALAGAK